MRAWITWLLPFAVLALAPAPRSAADQSPGFVVIVHPDNPLSSADRGFVADAFLKKATRWSDDSTINPVDAGPGSPVRRSFSQEVLKRSVAAVRSYWQQIVFSGHGVPPPELDSDEAIIMFVLKHRTAIGYVSERANLNGAKVLRLQ